MPPSYCLVVPRVRVVRIIASLYTIVLGLLIVLQLFLVPALSWPYLSGIAYIRWLQVA